jgi:hypothetical protein
MILINIKINLRMLNLYGYTNSQPARAVWILDAIE